MRKILLSLIAYQNERSVGQAIKDSGIPRDSIWVTSKLWPNEYGFFFSRKHFFDDNCVNLQAT